MIRHAGRATALLAATALFASGAWAQTATHMPQTVADPYLVAEELLGSSEGTVIKLGSAGGTSTANAPKAARPVVRLTVPAGTSVVEGNTAEATFALTGAVFGQNVGASALDLRGSNGTDSADGLLTEVVAGGSIGDGTITFRMQATGNIAAENIISFWVPDLRVTPATIGSMANSAGTGMVPVMGVGIKATVVEKSAVKGTTAGAGPFLPVVGAEDVSEAPMRAAVNNYMNRQVVSLADVINITLGPSANNRAEVDLADRTKFATANDQHTPPGSQVPVAALRVGALQLTVSGGTAPTADDTLPTNIVWTLDPARPAVDFNNTMATDDDQLDNAFAGNVDVMVKGAFNAADKVVYGSPHKAAKVAGGMAAVSVPITLLGGTTPFIYVPGGVDPLRPGTITAVAMLNFSAAGNATGKPVTSMGTIAYQGVETHAYVHGVVRPGGIEQSIVRVRCPGAVPCTVFASCYDQDGENYFGEAPAIPAGETAAVDSDAIGLALNGGWDKGRAACDLMSNADLEVQHMVRTAHGLINNSVVVGRDLAGERFDSIDKALSDICSSVEGHAGRAGNMGNNTPDDATDDVSMIAATMCRNVNAEAVADTVDANNPGTADGL